MPSSNKGIHCDGWWDQKQFGRQPMHQLRLQFDSGSISGSGVDVIGLFTFTGTMDAHGQVLMLKRYLGQHSVEYVGKYDGEGLMWGEWNIAGFKDRWLIKIKGSGHSADQPAEVAIIE